MVNYLQWSILGIFPLKLTDVTCGKTKAQNKEKGCPDPSDCSRQERWHWNAGVLQPERDLSKSNTPALGKAATPGVSSGAHQPCSERSWAAPLALTLSFWPCSSQGMGCAEATQVPMSTICIHLPQGAHYKQFIWGNLAQYGMWHKLEGPSDCHHPNLQEVGSFSFSHLWLPQALA